MAQGRRPPWYLCHVVLPPSFDASCSALIKVEHGVQGQRSRTSDAGAQRLRAHFKIPSSRLVDFHLGMAEASGCNLFAADHVGDTWTTYACPKRAQRR